MLQGRRALAELERQKTHGILSGRRKRRSLKEVDDRGQATRVNVMRTPDHARHLGKVAVDTVRRAGPYGAPSRDLLAGKRELVFTETWLFRDDERFQFVNFIDVTAVARFGHGWLAYVRPWFIQARTTEWEKEIYQAAVQYTKPGPVSLRLDLGYLDSPIGLGTSDIRPSTNPTIGPHFSFFIPMLPFDPGAPVVPPATATR